MGVFKQHFERTPLIDVKTVENHETEYKDVIKTSKMQDEWASLLKTYQRRLDSSEIVSYLVINHYRLNADKKQYTKLFVDLIRQHKAAMIDLVVDIIHEKLLSSKQLVEIVMELAEGFSDESLVGYYSSFFGELVVNQLDGHMCLLQAFIDNMPQRTILNSFLMATMGYVEEKDCKLLWEFKALDVEDVVVDERYVVYLQNGHMTDDDEENTQLDVIEEEKEVDYVSTQGAYRFETNPPNSNGWITSDVVEVDDYEVSQDEIDTQNEEMERVFDNDIPTIEDILKLRLDNDIEEARQQMVQFDLWMQLQNLY